MAELFTATHAVEQTDEEGNVSYTWTDAKSKSVMVNMFIRNYNVSYYFISQLINFKYIFIVSNFCL